MPLFWSVPAGVEKIPTRHPPEDPDPDGTSCRGGHRALGGADQQEAGGSSSSKRSQKITWPGGHRSATEECQGRMGGLRGAASSSKEQLVPHPSNVHSSLQRPHPRHLAAVSLPVRAPRASLGAQVRAQVQLCTPRHGARVWGADALSKTPGGGLRVSCQDAGPNPQVTQDIEGHGHWGGAEGAA